MNFNVLRRITGRTSVVLAAGTLLALSVANPALAATSQATAQAAKVTLGGTSLLDTGICSATNPGTGQVKSPTPPCTSPTGTPAPGTQQLITGGALVEDAAANNDGTSTACAGAVGPGGAIQIGATPSCTVVPAMTPGGVTLLGTTLLGIPGPSLLSADAIYATCSASSTGMPTGTSTVANLRLAGIPITVSPGVQLNIANLATLDLNKQVTDASGKRTVTAFDLKVLPGATLAGIDLNGLGLSVAQLLGLGLAPNVAGAEVIIGQVTCGPNAVMSSVPLLPLAGLPLAAATLAIVGGGVLVVRRHRSSTLVGG